MASVPVSSPPLTSENLVTSQQVIDLCKEHTLWTWTARNAVAPLVVDHAKGVYLYTVDGKKVIDFNSQLMSVNIGHSHPKVRFSLFPSLSSNYFVTFSASSIYSFFSPVCN